MGDSIEQRGRALEDAFFHRVDQKLIADMKARMKHEEARQALAQACPWADEAVLDVLDSSRITAESYVSLTLVPLVRVAWADGRIERNERLALLKAAHDNQCEEGSPGYQMLSAWLDDPPGEELFEAWKQYAGAISQELGPEAKQDLKNHVVERAQKVARAAGGILGLNAVSEAEQEVLDEIEAAFA